MRHQNSVFHTVSVVVSLMQYTMRPAALHRGDLPAFSNAEMIRA